MVAINVLDKTRWGLCKVLPRLISDTLAGYDKFAKSPPPENAKDFAAFHSGCKSALGHLAQLIKLAQWVETNSAPSPSKAPTDLEKLLQQARESVAEIREID